MKFLLLKQILHWSTAASVSAVLLTALPLGILAAIRPSEAQWLYWHMGAGWLIAAVSIIRFGRYAVAGDFPSSWRRPAAALMTILLFVLVAEIAAGLLAFRNSPMRAPLLVLNLFEAPVFFRDNHVVHGISVSFHRWLSYAIAGLVIVHASLGLQAWVQQRPRIGSQDVRP